MRRMLAAVCCAATFVSCLFLSACFDEKATLAMSTEYDITGISAIVLEYEGDNVSVTLAQDDMLLLDEYLSRHDSGMLASVSFEGDRMIIKGGERPSNGSMSAHVELQVPAYYKGSLVISTTSGQVNVLLDNDLERLSLQSLSGNLIVSGVSAHSIELFSRSGACRLSSTRMTGDISIGSDSGRLELALPKDQPMRLVACTVSGHLVIPYEQEPPTALSKELVRDSMSTYASLGHVVAESDFSTFESNQGMNPPGTIRLYTNSGRITVS
ncbi:MAG: DUF4097 family beta strand repeat protein [Coriobacteriales bacterium]|nr:DUF4097 family beta strand repeat protein [Coriobacteriales bacterium]MBQ6586567.1 DUF4097 family beta strand repeat protein [Coriobacteriales bacterium]